MNLPPDELGRRIKAARELRGLDQADLVPLFVGDGLDKTLPGAIERGEVRNGKPVVMRRAALDAFCRHLQMPEWWFTDATIDLPEHQPPPLEARLRRIEELLAPPATPSTEGAELQLPGPPLLDPQPTAKAADERQTDEQAS